MKNEVIVTAKTVDEAMAQARRQYGSSENELAFEILEMPKKGFLGLGATPAKVKVTITKALPDVDLSDLVSSIRNMKVATDRDGEEENRPSRTSPSPAGRKRSPTGETTSPRIRTRTRIPRRKSRQSPRTPPHPKPISSPSRKSRPLR